MDDSELAIRASGTNCNQHFSIGKDLITVEWYTSLIEAINGFKKNLFGAANYKIVIPSFHIIIEVLVFPVTIIVYLYTIFLSAFSAIKLGGIFWRRTFYILKALKRRGN